MKRLISLTIPGILLFIGCGTSSNGNLPGFNLLLTDSITVLNTAAIPKGRPILLMYFETDCEYCQKETRDIVDHIEKLKDVRFYLVSVNQLSDIKFYGQYYHLGRYPNIQIGRDTGFYILKHYTIRRTPQMMLFDKNKNLRGIMTGMVQSDTLVQKIRDL